MPRSAVILLAAPASYASGLVVGYPAFDPRNLADVRDKVISGINYVKRPQAFDGNDRLAR